MESSSGCGFIKRQSYLVTVAVCVVFPWLNLCVEGAIVMDKVYPDYTNHPCKRPCVANKHMLCVYDFSLEYSYTMGKACGDCPSNYTDCFQQGCVTTDGTGRLLMAVNKQIPGPAIHICEDDLVRVRVRNDLMGTEGTSIHWHGVLQRHSQHMDGVGRITQCLIPASTSFEYGFQADTPGTHYWHAHSGSQRADGIFGAFVVRQPPEQEMHYGLYDHDLPEHTFIVIDWYTEFTTHELTRVLVGQRVPLPATLLVNGRGVEQDFFDNPINRTGRNFLPIETFTVEQGKRYRFRVISNGINSCPIQISFDNHPLTVIASDGTAFDKLEVDSLYIHSGERYDFVIHANQPVDNYWIRLQGSEFACRTTKAFTAAILKYKGADNSYPAAAFSSYEEATIGGKSLNKWNVDASTDNVLLTNLQSRVVETEALKGTPDKKYYLKVDMVRRVSFRFGPKPVLLTEINNIKISHPPAPPLSQYADLDEDVFCNDQSPGAGNCSTKYCECAYRYKVALNDVVELVVLDAGPGTTVHPMHLHGHKFHVVGSKKLGDKTTLEEVKRLDDENKLHRNLASPVLKDTVATVDGGYVILRWHATNPGFWLFHCHNARHLLNGQGLIFQVGEVDDMPKPPANFPKCGNFNFAGYDSDSNVNQCTSGAHRVTSVGLSLFIFFLFLTRHISY